MIDVRHFEVTGFRERIHDIDVEACKCVGLITIEEWLELRIDRHRDAGRLC